MNAREWGALGGLRRLADEGARRPLKPAGSHLTRRHFYIPIPVVEDIPASLWDGPSELPAVNLRAEGSLALVNGPLLPYLSEFRPPLNPTEPGRFWPHNGCYDSVDASTLYAMLRFEAVARLRR